MSTFTSVVLVVHWDHGEKKAHAVGYCWLTAVLKTIGNDVSNRGLSLWLSTSQANTYLLKYRGPVNRVNYTTLIPHRSSLTYITRDHWQHDKPTFLPTQVSSMAPHQRPYEFPASQFQAG